jgi:putative NADH-flavin reductase
MKLVVFGATGGTGRRIVERALADGHDVVAVARKPEAIAAKHERLHVVKGDVLDPVSVAAAIAGNEAVLSSVGPASNKQPGTLISDGMKHIVAACTQTGVKRFVFESGLMVGDGTGLSAFSRIGVTIYRAMNKALCADKRIAEAVIRDSSLDWVIVRPPSLDDGAATDDVKHGVDARISAAKKMSHTDVATFMIRCATDASLVRTIQTIGH